MTAPCARGVATRAPTNPSSRSTRRSLSAPHISSPARRPTPRRPRRRRSCAPGWRCGASAGAPSFAHGCSRSSPTRRATACATGGAARAWRSAPPASSRWQPPAADAPELGDGRLREALAGAARARPQRDRLPLRARSRRAGDGRGARHRARHRQVAHGARARPPARRPGGGGMTLERDLRALAGGFPETPDARAARARGGARGRRAQAAPAARRGARARAAPARPGDGARRSRPTCATACSRRSGCAT